MSVLDSCNLEYIIPQGSFFICADTSKFYKSSKFPKIDWTEDPRTWPDWILTRWIAQNCRVTCLPMSAFSSKEYENRFRFLRFSFCVEDETFTETEKRLKKLSELL